ncbi:MAG: hypothetical protein WBE74_04945 [Terracidiphilus sp.]
MKFQGGTVLLRDEDSRLSMGSTVEKADSADREKLPEKVSAAEVRKTLSAILQSPPFHSSKQSQELLQYIVDQSLGGHLEMLKERIIGAHVFGRRPDYDTNVDPIVRARAAEVRKRLALYYQTAREEAVLIGIPSGSFKAIFEWADKVPHPLPATHPEIEGAQLFLEPVTPASPRVIDGPEQRSSYATFRGLIWWIAIAVAVILLGWAVRHYFASSDERAFNQFWSPVLDKSNPVLIYIGSNAVYELSPSYIDSYYKQHARSGNEEMGLESYIPLAPGTKIDVQDLYPAKDTFVTIGDVAATTKIVSLLVRRNRQFDIRYGNDVAYGDLLESPTILIGAHNNPWTLTMTGNLRYVFDGPMAIQDRSNTQKRWSANSDFTEDYAIVSRVLNSKTGTTVITAAGIGYVGTRAAAEFLTNPQSISALVKSLPKDWENKNLQIVLHTTAINQLPSTPDIVAIYCW